MRADDSHANSMLSAVEQFAKLAERESSEVDCIAADLIRQLNTSNRTDNQPDVVSLATQIHAKCSSAFSILQVVLGSFREAIEAQQGLVNHQKVMIDTLRDDLQRLIAERN